MKILITFLSLLVSVLAVSQSQMRKYAIIPNGGDTLGYVIVEKRIENNKISYTYSNEISVWFIKKFDIKSKMVTEFNDGVMKYSNVAHNVNGGTYKSARHNWMNGHYQIVKENKECDTLKKPVNYTAIRLFFDEPHYQELVYSETNCIYQPIKQVKQNIYKMVKDNGTENVYYYKKGILYRMDVGNKLKDFQLRLIDFT